ncbi:unnamed protein product [Schistocephalus solidus]|uniref:UPF0506 domain-containing protein n=1 Tax=Schistocephalus solidus TaxID=70667 RepID=A0A183TB17_SCHSO|nr:unnamed protein product [Schistocephalus solidus]
MRKSLVLPKLIRVDLLPCLLSADSCMMEGQTCSKTIFQRCCGTLLCDLKTFGDGKCVKCLDEGRRCGKDADCCSGRCTWLKCAAKENTTTTVAK